MKLHKEGTPFVTISLTVLAICVVLAVFFKAWYWYALSGLALFIALFMLRFFRSPSRPFKQVEGVVLSPCDGKVVIIQEVEEPEFFKDKRLQVSVFMSVHNVHINWAPLSGTVEYFRHHQGKYLVAWHEKSSTKNERTTFVVNTGTTKVLFRQIAGYVARRIVTYVEEGDKVDQNQQIGFIKFGSRMDLFFPLGTEICVKNGDIVTGTESIIAKL